MTCMFDMCVCACLYLYDVVYELYAMYVLYEVVYDAMCAMCDVYV